MIRQRAAVLPLIAILLPVLLVLAGLAINVAYIQLTSTQLQISTDLAAKAAGREYAITRDRNAAKLIANQFGALNKVAGKDLVFQDADIRIGTSTLSVASSRYQFAQAPSEDDGSSGLYNALEILGRRTSDSGNGEVSTYFPNLMGKTSFALQTTSVSTQVEIDVALVLDRSGSMAYADTEVAAYPPIPAAAPDGWFFEDPCPSNARWLDAVSAIQGFLDELNTSPMQENVGLVTYADGANIDHLLTTNYAGIRAQLDAHTAAFSGGGTNIAAGLQAGQAQLGSAEARDFAGKVVIILTDGKRTVGSSPTLWANLLADDGIMIITVTFSAEADQSQMQAIASIGNGFHIHAETGTDLVNAFRQISRRLPTLLTR